ncbi:DAK2 domain-containing protein [Mycoplasmatota bacterium]|nr:DAK2 domain-containing protein [Mycoplasmatota bacterium]
MNIKKLNGLLFKTLVENGAINLSNNYKYIDDLNVFPVPDGDTGTNMKMTINSGVQEIANLKIESMDEMSKKLSRGLLMGARGNSGVILSQLFRGLHKGFSGHDLVGPTELVAGFRGGVDQAYKSVMNPVEGTILTVAREATEYLEKNVSSEMTINETFKMYLDEAKASLERTPELLDKLKEAGVIDSGGAGYVLIIEGMYKALQGEFIQALDDSEMQSSSAIVESNSEEFGYCTEFIIQMNNEIDVEDELKSALAYLGDSIVIVQDEDIIKVHIHTLTPGDALNIAQKYGEFARIKIDNMSLQHEEIINEASTKNDKGPMKKYGVVAVAQGKGLVKMFYDFGCDKVVTGGQTMNPSTEDIVKAINNVHAENVLVFPNNKNIMLAAEQAQDLVSDKNVIVIAAKTIATGYSALSMLDLNAEPEDIKEEIEGTIEDVSTGEITYAIRDTSVNGVNIKESDFMGILNGKIVVSTPSLDETLKSLTDEMVSDAEIITIIYGEDVSKNEVEDLEKYIEEKHSEVEVDIIEGKQAVYNYIFAVE